MGCRMTGVFGVVLAILVSPGWGQSVGDGMTTSTLVERLLERHGAYSELFDGEGSVRFRMTRSVARPPEVGASLTTESLTRFLEQSVAGNTILWDFSDTGDEVLASDAPLMFSLIQFDWGDSPILLDVHWSARQAQFRRADSVREVELMRLGFPSMVTTIAAQRLESAEADGEASRVTVREVSATSHTSTFEFDVPAFLDFAQSIRVTVGHDPFVILRETQVMGTSRLPVMVRNSMITKSDRTYTGHGEVSLGGGTHHLPAHIEIREARGTGGTDFETIVYERVDSIQWNPASAAARFKGAGHDMRALLMQMKSEGFVFSVDSKMRLPGDLAELAGVGEGDD